MPLDIQDTGMLNQRYLPVQQCSSLFSQISHSLLPHACMYWWLPDCTRPTGFPRISWWLVLGCKYPYNAHTNGNRYEGLRLTVTLYFTLNRDCVCRDESLWTVLTLYDSTFVCFTSFYCCISCKDKPSQGFQDESQSHVAKSFAYCWENGVIFNTGVVASR